MRSTATQTKSIAIEPDCEFSTPQYSKPEAAHLCGECGAHRFAAVHRTSRALVDSRAEIRTIDELGHADACSVERSGWRLAGIIESFGRFCSDWSYSDVLYRANLRAFEERFDGVDYIEGREGLLFDAEDIDAAGALIETFDALEDYPVIDEEIVSQLEDEEFWETLTTCFDIPEDVEAADVASWLQQNTSCYRADDLSQERVDDAIRYMPHLWRNRFDETADESDLHDLIDACRYCDKTLTSHAWLTDVTTAEAAGQLPLLPELALTC